MDGKGLDRLRRLTHDQPVRADAEVSITETTNLLRLRIPSESFVLYDQIVVA
jgi:hypothetical protein